MCDCEWKKAGVAKPGREGVEEGGRAGESAKKKKKRLRSVEHSLGRKPRHGISFRLLTCWKNGPAAAK